MLHSISLSLGFFLILSDSAVFSAALAISWDSPLSIFLIWKENLSAILHVPKIKWNLLSLQKIQPFA